MPVYITSKSNAIRHGVYAIEKTPPSVIQPLGTGVIGYVAQFPWGPKDTVYEPTNLADAKSTFAPAGMSRTGSGYLGLLAKAFPALRIVRVLGSAAAKATATLVEDVAETAATVTGTGDLSNGALYGVGGTLDGLTVIAEIDNGGSDTCTFVAPANKAAVLSQLNAAIGAGTAFTAPGNFLVITSPTTGTSSEIDITGGTALTALGLTVATTTGTDPDVNVATVTAKYEGTAGNSLIAEVFAASDGDSNHFNLKVSVTGASGTTEDLIENINFSAVGTQTVFADLPASQRNALRLVGNVVRLANGRPTNATYTFSSGADGTIDATRYVGTASSADRGISLLEGDMFVRHVAVDDPGNSIRDAVNAGLVAHATLMGNRVAYLNGDSGQTAAAARTDKAAYSSARAYYVDPWVYIYDDTTAAEQLVPPAMFAASVAAQLSPSTAIAWKNSEVQAMLQGIVRLEALRGEGAGTNTQQGIVTIIREEEGGFTFEADVLTIAPADPAKKRGTRTRMLDYIATAALRAWRQAVDAPNVESNRDDLRVSLDAFMDGLKRAQFSDPNHTPHVIEYAIAPLDASNTAESIAAGDVEIALDVQFSSATEHVFLAIKGGESPVVSVQA